jgi:hypothetical protein
VCDSIEHLIRISGLAEFDFTASSTFGRNLGLGDDALRVIES